MRRVLLTAISCIVATGVARAEPLAGDYELSAGAHAMALIGPSCEHDVDVVSCQDALLFAGFQLGGDIQLGPWFALGLRVAGSTELDSTQTVSSQPDAALTIVERDLWLWQLALQARFDPPLWPRGLWLGAEVGVAFSVDDVDELDSSGETTDSQSFGQTLLLLAAVVGYDIALGEGFLLGFELRGQYLSLRTLPGPRTGFGDRELEAFPYVSLGAHLGMRW